MKFPYYLILMLLFFSCKESIKGTPQVIEKPETSIAKKHDKIITVEAKFESKIETWAAYETFTTFIDRYQIISPVDAINNSRELNILTKSLNDSIKPAFLESSAFNARLNLLFNETLRLYDMSSIPSIKAIEVNKQVDKVLQAFSSINSKINTVILQTQLDKDVEDVNFKRKESVLKETDRTPEKKLQVLKNEKSKKYEKRRLMKEGVLKKRKPTISEIQKKKKDVKKKDN